MAAKFKEQALLFERIPRIEDVQVGWLLLVFCAATRANYWLRTVPPEHTLEYAEQHDQSVLRCLSSILQMDGLPPQTHEAASMPLTMGGLGVGGCSRIWPVPCVAGQLPTAVCHTTIQHGRFTIVARSQSGFLCTTPASHSLSVTTNRGHHYLQRR